MQPAPTGGIRLLIELVFWGPLRLIETGAATAARALYRLEPATAAFLAAVLVTGTIILAVAHIGGGE